MNKTKFCGDVHCKHSGPIPLSEFGRSAYYDRFADKSGLNRYCKASNRRRTREHPAQLQISTFQDKRTYVSKDNRGGEEPVNEAERIKKIDELQYELFDLEERRLYLLGQMQLFKNTGTKVCRKCNQERTIKMFYTDTRYKDDHSSWCKFCKSNDVKERNRRNAA